jgi:hypothetical protein
MNLLFREKWGTMLMGALVMQTVGFVWIRQVIKIQCRCDAAASAPRVPLRVAAGGGGRDGAAPADATIERRLGE